jgi:1-acyl-sn-glycerol-3-phosphate acyltransferase
MGVPPSLAYFMGTHKDIFIVLKKSLKWVPVLGWVWQLLAFGLMKLTRCQGMQFFRFIFLARSWESDRATMARRLAKLGQRVQGEDLPLSFVFFPEGTLVSKDTRPISKKFADKTGIVSFPFSRAGSGRTDAYSGSRIWCIRSCRARRGCNTSCAHSLLVSQSWRYWT